MIRADFEDTDLIQAIKDSVKPEIIERNGQVFSTESLVLVPERSLTNAIKVHSLTAIVDYLKAASFDEKVKSNVVVVVDSPTSVVVRHSIAEDTGRRFTPVESSPDLPVFHFGQYMSLEDMVIGIQAAFVQNDDEDAGEKQILRMLSQVVATDALTQADDGVSQSVTLQSGIKRAESEVPNPVILRPFRTFAEVEQPESPFVFRLKKSGDSGMLASLHLADGGKWSNQARLNIKEFLDKALGDSVPVLA